MTKDGDGGRRGWEEEVEKIQKGERRKMERRKGERGGGGGRERKGVNEVHVDEQGGLVHVGGRRRG